MIKHNPRCQQHGVYTILTLFVLLMGMGASGVLAIGHIAWEKDRLQGVADLVALTAARQLSNGPGFVEAREIAQENGLQLLDEMQIVCIVDNVASADCDNATTSRVTITRPVNALMAFLSDQELTVVAEASVMPSVVGSVSSGLLSVDSTQSSLLNGLLSGVGGGAVNLSIAQWNGLLNTNVQVDLLDLKTKLSVATVSDLLALNVSARTLLRNALLVSNANSAQQVTIDGALNALNGPLNSANVLVGDVLAVDLSGRTNTPLNVNFGHLAQVTLLKAAQGVAYTLPITSGALNLSVKVNILEAPQVFAGRKISYKNPIASAKTSQVALEVRVRQPSLGVSIPSVVLGALDLNLQMRLAGGSAQINELNCRYPRASNNLVMTVEPALTQVCIANSSSNLNTTVGSLTCGAPANVANVTLLGLVNAAVTVAAAGSLNSNPVQHSQDGVAPFSHTVILNGGETLKNLFQNLNLDLRVNLPVVSPLIVGTVNGLVATLVNALKPILRPILGTVGDTLDNLLKVLGIGVNQVNVNVHSVDCQSVVLTR